MTSKLDHLSQPLANIMFLKYNLQTLDPMKAKKMIGDVMKNLRDIEDPESDLSFSMI